MADLTPKLSIDATKAIVFCVVFLGCAGLIATGKLDAEYLKFLLAWLIPGPLNFDKAQSDSEKTTGA